MKGKQRRKKNTGICFMLCAAMASVSLWQPVSLNVWAAETVGRDLGAELLVQTKTQAAERTDIDQGSLKASADSAQEAAGNAIDGDISTKWHTSWDNGHSTVPLSIILELPQEYGDLTQLRYLPRQDKKGEAYQWNGDILDYEIWVSNTDKEESSFKKAAEGKWADDKEEKSATFSPVSAKYVKLTAIHTKGNKAEEYDQFASAAEIYLAHGGSVDIAKDKQALAEAISKAQEYLDGVGAGETGTAVLKELLKKGKVIVAYDCPAEEDLQKTANALAAETERLKSGKPSVEYNNFTPNGEWLDHTGMMIQAHGGGIIWDENTKKYYWYGEHKGENNYSAGVVVPIGVSCYSSTDLYNWKNEGVALPVFNNPAFLGDGQITSDTPMYLAESSQEYQAAKASGKKVAPNDTLEKYNSSSYIEELNELYKDETPEKKRELYGKLNWQCVLERPKVIYNDATKKYVMWFHKDGEGVGKYDLAQTGIAVSDSPAGPFKLIDCIRPNGHESRDMTLFKDDDGKAYLLHSCEGNNTLYMEEMNEDYTGLTGNYSRNYVEKGGTMAIYAREAPAVFKYKNNYYIITSGCTGWAPNQMGYSVTDDIRKGMTADGGDGPFQMDGLKNPCVGTDADISFYGQSAYILPVQGKDGCFIYIGDKWNSGNLKDSRYQWLPIQVDSEEKALTISWNDTWRLDDFDNLNSETRINLNRTVRNGKRLSAQENDFGQERWKILQNLLAAAGDFSYQMSSDELIEKTGEIQKAVQELEKWRELDQALAWVKEQSHAETEFTAKTWKKVMEAYEKGKSLKEGVSEDQIKLSAKEIMDAVADLESRKVEITEELSLAGKKIAADSEESEGSAEKAIDGDNTTIWHSNWKNSTPLPHYLTIDLGEAYGDLCRLCYLPRQDKSNNGIITKYRVLVSNADKTLEELEDADFTEVRKGTWEENKEEKSTVFCTEGAVKYLRFEAVEGVGDFASAAELKLFRGELEKDPEEPNPWETDLAKAIKDYNVEDSNKGLYTEASWNTYRTALHAALDLQKKENYTEAESEKAIADLQKAYRELEKKNQTTPIKIETIKITGSITKLAKGKTVTLKATVEPQNAADKSLKWSSSDTKVAKVDQNGVVTAVGKGTVRIKAEARDGSETQSNIYNIIVVNHAVKRITLKSESKTIAAGQKTTVEAVLAATGRDFNKNLKWVSSNDKYAAVNKKGVVTVKKAGAGHTVAITAEATDGSGKKAIIKIKIVKDSVKKITLKCKSKNVRAGKKVTVKATVAATGKTANKKLKWISSNKKYATVSQKGIVSAKRAGKGKNVTIKAVSTDGTKKKASVKIRIR